MKSEENNTYRVRVYQHATRILITLLFFGFLIAILIFRLIQLQIIYGQSLYNKSLDNQYTFANLQAQRGLILDRNGHVLANNKPKFHLELSTQNKRDTMQALQTLIDSLHIPNEHLEKIKDKINNNKKTETIRILKDLKQEELHTIYKNSLHIMPFKVVPEFNRHYPHGDCCSAVTGYVLAKKTAKDKKSSNPNILATHSGAEGIEKYYDKILSGKSGVAQLQRDAKGNILQSISDIPAQNGADLTLTIDLKLQEIIKNKMQNKRGAVIVSNPSNGEILGLFSAPSYDPNAFLDPNMSTELEYYLKSSKKPLFNRVISGQFPPASTVKPFLALYALDHAIIDRKFSIYDPGYFRYKNTENIYRNWNRGGHGRVDTHKAIVVSNDTFFYHLAIMTGIDTMRDIYASYGFGNKTGIDLSGEKSGLVPDRSWKKKRGQSWLIGDTIITGIGQGSMLTTPIQMAQAINIFANQGENIQLHLVKSIKQTDNQPMITQPSKSTKYRSADQRNWGFVTSAMQKVIKLGTGKRFGHHDLPFAAKTGTAQLIKDSWRLNKAKHLSDHSWFIGFLVKDPSDFSITVLIENENDAILVAKEIIEDYFNTADND